MSPGGGGGGQTKCIIYTCLPVIKQWFSISVSLSTNRVVVLIYQSISTVNCYELP